jgi:prolyl-tRNA synthetase
MKASQFFISTLKEAPADAEVVSHQLMMRAGMIKRLGAGIYNYMPMGLRVIRKVEAIIREEMNRAGAVELLMPVVQPAELWQETGRFQDGPELLRVKDRHDRDFIIQPTSEEVITDIARQELRSYKQLPKNFYHIQTKFRDERRPRFGVMRGREFTMKDAYSFDRDKAAAMKSYEAMFAAYSASSTASACTYRAVAADTGAIGGDLSHEFQVIADTGEDAIVYCPDSDYAANIELAEAVALPPRAPRRPRRWPRRRRRARAPAKTWPSCWACRCAHRQVAGAGHRRVKRGRRRRQDHGLAAAGARRPQPQRGQGRQGAGLKDGFRFATVAEIEDHFGCKPGYLGPIGTRKPVKVVADRTVAAMSDFVCGANEADFHSPASTGAATCPSPTSWPTSATSSPATRRPTARACWPSSAASRSAMCSTSAPSTARR